MWKACLQLLASAVLAVALAGGATAQSVSMKLTKTDIGAPPETVFALIEDFRAWSKWSPHEKADPAVQRSFAGSEKGQGASYRWAGGDDIGHGFAQITRSDPPRSMFVDLDVQKPVAGRLTLEFTFTPAGAAATKMEVAAKGEAALVKYVMSTFFGDSLMRIACAVEASPKPFCTFLMKDVGKQ